jgi:hypothetical protein
MRTLGRLIVGVLATLAMSLPAAHAQTATGLEPGVHVDPGSPAAKEYAVPLNQARQTGANPASHEGPPAGVPFGAGIHPPGARGSSHLRARANGSHARALHTISKSSPADAPGTDTVVSPVALRAASSGGDRSLLTLLGGAAAILLLGAFGGTLIRRGRRSLSSS